MNARIVIIYYKMWTVKYVNYYRDPVDTFLRINSIEIWTVVRYLNNPNFTLNKM